MPTIIFGNTYRELADVKKILRMYKMPFVKTQKQYGKEETSKAIHMFESGKCGGSILGVNGGLLLATDKLSRGVDFKRARRVVNWSPPYSLGDYLNRAGRLGRLGHTSIGQVHTFICSNSGADAIRRIQVLEESVRRQVKLHKLDENFNFDQHEKLNRYKNPSVDSKGEESTPL